MGCVPSNRKIIVTEVNINKNSSLLEKTINAAIKREISLRINSSVFIKEVNENPFEQYEILNKLGEGGYGKVYKVKHKKMGSIRAMKIINKYKDKTQLDLYEDIEIENLKIKIDQRKYEDERFLKEIDILKKLDHPNIMRIYEFYNREHRFYLICEYIEGEELFEKITASKYFTEEHAAIYMQQILNGVNYCHKMGITHRDLKPENILVEETDKANISIKIIDFGTSAMISPNEKLTKKTGTSFYIAPEVLQGKYNEKCDIWSCGIIMYILLCGGPPFNGSNNNEIFSAILEEKLAFKGEIWRYITDEAVNLIRNMLQKKPEKRLSAAEILQSKWFSTNIHNQFTSTGIVSNGDDVKVISVIENLRTFKAEKKLQQAVLSFIVHDLSTDKEIQFLKKLFTSIDKDFDGKLSKKELYDFMNKFCNIDISSDLDQMFNNMDADKNGAIEFEEFLMASISKNKILNEKSLKQAFERFDFDKNGKIDAKEIKKIFQTLNGAVDENVWANLITKVDIDGDGEINFDEFKQMMNLKIKK